MSKTAAVALPAALLAASAWASGGRRVIAILGPNGQPVYSQMLGAQYTGEKTGGEFVDWNYFQPDSNNFISQSYGLLTAYCSTLYHTSALARAAVEKPLSYAIGNALVFRSHLPERILDIGKDEAREWARHFTELLHLEKLASGYYARQQELAREAKITGDSLLFVLYRENGEIDFVSSGGYHINWRAAHLGLELDNERRPIAAHLDTGPSVGGGPNAGSDPVRFLSASGDLQLLHFKFAARPQQLRGLSCFYSEIARAKNLDRWWDATLERVVIESILIGTLGGDSQINEVRAGELARRVTGKDVKGSNFRLNRESHNFKPGSVYGAEKDLQFSKPETPSNTFGLANEWTWKSFGAAVGYPPEFLLGQYSTSFTAHKGALNDAWTKILQERQHFALSVERQVNAVLLKKFVREGQLKAFGDLNDRRVLEAHLQGAYLGPVPGHINPAQEVKALETAVKNGFMLRSDGAAKYGNNFWDMIDEWEEEEKRHRALSPKQQAKVLEQQSRQPNDKQQEAPEEQEEQEDKK
ncbi:MAG: phage portal protein [Spirochaetota bacterium]